MLMLAGVRALHHCMDDRYQSSSLILTVVIFFLLDMLFPQYSIVCVLSENVLHQLAAPNPCCLVNI